MGYIYMGEKSRGRWREFTVVHMKALLHIIHKSKFQALMGITNVSCGGLIGGISTFSAIYSSIKNIDQLPKQAESVRL